MASSSGSTSASPTLTDDATPSDRISKRDRERRNAIEKRREEKQQLLVETEQAGYFKAAFHANCRAIRGQLEGAAHAQPSALPALFDRVNRDVQLLKNYLFESRIFLKVYDVRRAQEALQALESEAAQLEASLVPRKRFGFKKRPVIKSSEVEQQQQSSCDLVTDRLQDLKIVAAESEQKQLQQQRSSDEIRSKYGDNTCILRGKVDEELTLDAENVNRNDVALSELRGCKVRVYGAPNTLHLAGLERCRVLVGPVTTSVFVDDCRECEFAFACQQLRLHSSRDCRIYLHVTSRAIIEDCRGIRVAPYSWTYEDQASHFKLAGLDQRVNNWSCVDDFDWLSQEKSSPNWAVLEPELRRKSWDSG